MTSLAVMDGRLAAEKMASDNLPMLTPPRALIPMTSASGMRVRRWGVRSLRSVLLLTTISWRSAQRESMSAMSAAEGMASTSQRTMVASVIFLYANLMPICSMVSDVVRRPAVSIKRKVTPWMSMRSSIVSRVVP